MYLFYVVDDSETYDRLSSLHISEINKGNNSSQLEDIREGKQV